MTPSRRDLLPLATSTLVPAGLAGAQVGPVLGETARGTVLPAGVHRVESNTVVKGDLLLQPGATIAIAAGRTLTLLGVLVAPVAAIFTGPGTVDLNRSRIAFAHPEWWGAAPGDGERDSLPALQACLRAHPAMQLLAADYFISGTWVIDRAFCRVAGVGFRGTQGGQGTRIVVTNGRDDVMQVGPASRPATVNDFPQNIDVRALALARSQAVDVSGGATPAGLRAQFLLFAHIEQVSAFEHAAGFVARGLVRSTLRDCVAFRSIPGRQAGQPWRGFLLDGSGDIGLAGGNASLFLLQCNATIGGDPAVSDAVGLLLEGAFADTFVVDFETAGVATGIRVDGRAAAIGARGRAGHINLHLRMPVIDQCARVGIEVRDTSAHALVDITEPYVAVGPAAEAALRLDGARGAVSVTGGQLAGGTSMTAGGRAVGLAVRDSRGLQVDGLKMLEHPRPVVFERCSGFALRLQVANPASRPGGDAVSLGDCDSGTAAILLSGQDGAFSAGVRTGGRTGRLRLDATGIAADAVGGAANRIVAGARPLPVPFRDSNLAIEGV